MPVTVVQDVEKLEHPAGEEVGHHHHGVADVQSPAAVAIPLFYLPAMFFDSTSHFSVVDTWRFWIIHLGR